MPKNNYPHEAWQGKIQRYVPHNCTPISKLTGNNVMAKSNTVLVKLVSSADTGYYYVAKKNPRKMPDKIELKKYDPKVRKHVLFKEEKIK